MRVPDSYTIRLVGMPSGIEGMIAESPDGHINIYINDKLTQEKQAEVAKHELLHWENGDLDSQENIRAVESQS